MRGAFDAMTSHILGNAPRAGEGADVITEQVKAALHQSFPGVRESTHMRPNLGAEEVPVWSLLGIGAWRTVCHRRYTLRVFEQVASCADRIGARAEYLIRGDCRRYLLRVFEQVANCAHRIGARVKSPGRACRGPCCNRI